jgi:hypothetical protein
MYPGELISPQPDQEGHKLQRPNSDFCKPFKKNAEGGPSNQVSVAAMTSTLDKKLRPFYCFFSSEYKIVDSNSNIIQVVKLHDPSRIFVIEIEGV